MTQYDRALEILKNNMAKLHDVAKVLFNEEKIDGERFAAIMEENRKTISE